MKIIEANKIISGYMEDISRRKCDLSMEIKREVDEAYNEPDKLFNRLDKLMKAYDDIHIRENELNAQKSLLMALMEE